MFPIVRMYPSEQQARDAAQALEEAGFSGVAILTSAAGGEAEAIVRATIEAGQLPASHASVCTGGLQQGRSIVSVSAPFGAGQRATVLLEEHGPVETEAMPAHTSRNPSPFSDMLGLPVLADYSPMTDLSIIPYTFGEPSVASRNPAPLSSLLGLKTLTASKTSKRSSFGIPLLSQNPTPLSSLLRLKPLSSFRSDKKTSFGLSLLSRNPTPISSLFGLRVLSRKKKDRD
ncbi:MAG: hypothetical protein QNK03_19780 [Myxococcota bacterium]|nr:hypothetical protein [Myxococcota bacterium]